MKTIIKIEGMSCMHCVAAVRTALEKLAGVTAVEVVLDKKLAEVEYDDTIVSCEDMIKAVGEQGFDACL